MPKKIITNHHSKPSISAFFPAYNEAANLPKLISTTDDVLKKISSSYEIIIVNDGSHDNSALIVKKISPKNKNIKLISHRRNLGYGGALRSGFRAATNEYVFFADADLQFNIKELIKFMPYIYDYDIIIGYRAPRIDSFIRRLNAYGWKLLIGMLFGLKIKDIDCAFKLFSRQAIKNLNFHSNGAMISAEILIKLSQKGYRIKEIPVKHYPRISGRQTGAKPKIIIRAFKELFNFYWQEKKTR